MNLRIVTVFLYSMICLQFAVLSSEFVMISSIHVSSGSMFRNCNFSIGAFFPGVFFGQRKQLAWSQDWQKVKAKYLVQNKKYPIDSSSCPPCQGSPSWLQRNTWKIRFALVEALLILGSSSFWLDPTLGLFEGQFQLKKSERKIFLKGLNLVYQKGSNLTVWI